MVKSMFERNEFMRSNKGEVRVGERTLRLVEAGSGDPTVVLEAGAGDTALAWAAVFASVAARTHVVAYDRAGLGASDPGPSVPSLDSQVADLGVVLVHSAAGRCVLVGQSWGGLLAQMLTFRHPELVAGLVLVDPYHEELLTNLPGWIRRLIRLVNAHLRQPIQRVTGGVSRGQLAESRGIASSLPRIRQSRATSTFPDVPVIVLSATRGLPWPLRRRWTTLQAAVARAAPRGTHVVVAGAGHDIHRSRPDLVAETILGVVEEVRLSGR